MLERSRIVKRLSKSYSACYYLLSETVIGHTKMNPITEPIKPAYNAPAKSIYANAFEIQLSNSDFMLVLTGGAERYELHLSMTLGKTLAEKLTDIVGHVEAEMKQKLFTADQMNAILASLRQKFGKPVEAEK
jgi:hypothetical protein